VRVPAVVRRQAGDLRRLPHSNRYILTADGIRIAIFHTKNYNRLLVPLTADQPQAHPTYEPHCPQSTDTSTTAPPAHDYRRPPET
jgi:hypothetical protein